MAQSLGSTAQVVKLTQEVNPKKDISIVKREEAGGDRGKCWSISGGVEGGKLGVLLRD